MMTFELFGLSWVSLLLAHAFTVTAPSLLPLFDACTQAGTHELAHIFVIGYIFVCHKLASQPSSEFKGADQEERGSQPTIYMTRIL